MTTESHEISKYLFSDSKMSDFFVAMQENLRKSNEKKGLPPTPFTWSNSVLEEITPNVVRSLRNKYRACEKKGFNAAKIAGLYTFWIAKLKPIFSPFTASRALNEFFALNVGVAYIQERTQVQIHIQSEELVELCTSLRYHTSSPHALMHLFQLLIEKAKLKQQLEAAKAELKRHGIAWTGA